MILKRQVGLLIVVLSLLSLSACASNKFDALSKQVKAASFSYLNSYDMALKDYKAGKVMEARARVLAMASTRKDYKQARALLKNKIHPARIRLLRHYKSKGKQAQKSKHWAKAMDYYLETAEFSAKPEIFIAYARDMEMEMRKERMRVLLNKRALEDKEWLTWLQAYEPPRGLAVQDSVFLRQRKRIRNDVEDRAINAYREARRYLRKGMAGIAYVEILSSLRLVPDSEKGQNLMLEVQQAMPKPLLKVLEKRGVKKVIVKKKTMKSQPELSKRSIRALIKKAAWLEAHALALAYRHHDGKGADKLLQEIDFGLKKTAAVLFNQGLLAFRQEHIDVAVKFWKQAVLMQPENKEYVDAKHRAMQLQEHLHLLQNEPKSSDSK